MAGAIAGWGWYPRARSLVLFACVGGSCFLEYSMNTTDTKNPGTANRPGLVLPRCGLWGIC